MITFSTEFRNIRNVLNTGRSPAPPLPPRPGQVLGRLARSLYGAARPAPPYSAVHRDQHHPPPDGLHSAHLPRRKRGRWRARAHTSPPVRRTRDIKVPDSTTRRSADRPTSFQRHRLSTGPKSSPVLASLLPLSLSASLPLLCAEMWQPSAPAHCKHGHSRRFHVTSNRIWGGYL